MCIFPIYDFLSTDYVYVFPLSDPFLIDYVNCFSYLIVYPLIMRIFPHI